MFQIGPIKIGRNQFECPFCQKIMRTGDKMRRHIRIHTGERPYTCQICGQTFNQNSALQTHIKGQHPYRYI